MENGQISSPAVSDPPVCAEIKLAESLGRSRTGAWCVSRSVFSPCGKQPAVLFCHPEETCEYLRLSQPKC